MTPEGNYLIIVASKDGYTDIVRELIKADADVNERNNEDLTALIKFFRQGSSMIRQKWKSVCMIIVFRIM